MNESLSVKIVKTRGSVSKDEAVALLLGWGVERKGEAYVRLGIFGIEEDAFRTMPLMGQTVDQILTDLLNAAQDVGQYAIFIDDEDLAIQAQAKIERCNQLINEADGFAREITTELARGSSSQLQYATPDHVSEGRMLLTFDSLDAWARKRYKFSIRSGSPIRARPLFQDEGDESDKYGPDKVRNLMVTLALMVELYTKIGPPYSKSDDSKEDASEDGDFEASYSAIANVIAKFAQSKRPNNPYRSQSESTIRKLLKTASLELDAMLQAP